MTALKKAHSSTEKNKKKIFFEIKKHNFCLYILLYKFSINSSNSKSF